MCSSKIEMWKVKKRAPVWLGVIFVLLFFLVSPLLMPHSPVLDLDGNQCATISDKKTKKDKTTVTNPRKVFGDEFVQCPDTKFPTEDTNEGWPTFREALKRYSEFHREKLKQLKESPLGEGVRTLTWACSQAKCSGLGDQLFRIEYFLLLAIMSDRLFTVYWDEALERSAKYLIPNDIDWSYFDSTKGMCTDRNGVFSGKDCPKTTYSCNSMWGFGWTKDEFAHFGDVLFGPEEHITITGDVKAYVMFINKEFYMNTGEKITAGFEKLGLHSILEKESPNDTVSCGHNPVWYTMLHKLGAHHFMEIPEVSSGKVIASEPWLQVSHVIFCYLFQFPQLLVTEVDQVSRSLGIDDKQYTAVHLRTGFKGMPYEESYVTRRIHKNWKFFDDVYVWDGILAHTFELADTMLGSDSPVYLCTDTDVAKERYQKKYGERIKIADLSLTHSAHSRSKCQQEIVESTEENTPEPSDAPPSIYDDPYVSMWIDFLLLSRAHVMVHGDSSFSVNACFVKPISHVRQSWVMHDNDLNCVAAYVGNTTTCIC